MTADDVGDPVPIVPVVHFMRRAGQVSTTFVTNAVEPLATPRDVVACLRREEGAGPQRVPVVSVDVRSDRLNRHSPAVHTIRRAHRLWVLLARSRARVVHVHFAYSAEVALLAARWAGVPSVVSAWGHDVLVDRPPLAVAALLNRADAVVVPGPWLADRLVAMGVDDRRIVRLPVGIDLHAHRPDARGPAEHIAFVGRFVEKKGVLDLVAAVHEASRLLATPLRACLAGFGPLEDDLRRAAALGPGAIEVYDGRDPAIVDDIYRRALMVVTPSVTADNGDAETLCYVNVEAQARMLPVVTTAHGGIADGLAPGAALVVQERRPDLLARAIIDVYEDVERRAAMGRAGRAFVEQEFELVQQAAALRRLYEALAGRRWRRLIAGGPEPPTALRPPTG